MVKEGKCQMTGARVVIRKLMCWLGWHEFVDAGEKILWRDALWGDGTIPVRRCKHCNVELTHGDFY